MLAVARLILALQSLNTDCFAVLENNITIRFFKKFWDLTYHRRKIQAKQDLET